MANFEAKTSKFIASFHCSISSKETFALSLLFTKQLQGYQIWCFWLRILGFFGAILLIKGAGKYRYPWLFLLPLVSLMQSFSLHSYLCWTQNCWKTDLKVIFFHFSFYSINHDQRELALTKELEELRYNCQPSKYGNGVCDWMNNNEWCFWDVGDCSRYNNGYRSERYFALLRNSVKTLMSRSSKTFLGW